MWRSWLPFALVFGASCQGAEECRGWGSTPTWSDCGDKLEREVRCEPSGAPPPGTPVKAWTCKCLVSGVIGKSFEMTETSALADRGKGTAIANQQCGWQLSAR